MNVLPLVSAFILLFAIGSYTFIHQFHAAYFEKESYSASMRVQRNFRDAIEKQRYAKYPGKPPPKDTQNHSPKTNKKQTTYTSPRDKASFPECKLNLTTLAKEENPLLEKVALELIRKLYEFTKMDIDPEDLFRKLVKTLKKDPSIDTFEKLLASTPKTDAPLLYKLIKGTYEYQLFTSKGIPPLGDFFSLDPTSHAKPIHFAHASRILLQAYFGDLIAPHIIQEEKIKWEAEEKHTSLKKEELEALLLKHRKNPSDYMPLLSFTTSKSQNSQKVLQDKNSSLKLKFN